MSDNIHESAIRWQLRMADGSLDALSQRELDQWLGADSRHRQALAEVGSLWFGCSMLTETAASAPTRPAARHARNRLAWAAAAVLFVALAALMNAVPTWWTRLAADEYTLVGEVRTFALPDGSRVTLDTDSAIDVDYLPGGRRLRLLQGAAYFDVAHDATRPFAVSAGDVVAIALGTRFAVENTADGLAVTVESGLVQVQSPGSANRQVAAGEQLRVHAGSLEQQRAPGNALTWRHGVLVFDNVSLGEAMRDLDRYTPGRILLLGAGVAELRTSAVLPVDDPYSAIDALARTHDLRVAHWPWLTVVRPQRVRP